MPHLSVMFKTVSSDCNLDCSYCYYRQSLEGTRVRRRMDEAVLARFIDQYMDYVADCGVASIAWQGGEPTLAGPDFFERAIELEGRHARGPVTIGNALQTNAVLLDDRWGELLARYRFLVGVSLDGPEDLHDALRRDRGGHGSFRRVMAGLDVLRRHGVEFNVLCVVGGHNVDRAPDLLRFFRGEGVGYAQFIPAMGFQSTSPDEPATYLVNREQYGQFLVDAFDAWYDDGFPTVSVRLFDTFLQSLLGTRPGMCVHSDRCDSGIVVEYNGDVFPCDFYVHPRWRLGNVMEEPLAAILARPARAAFVARKAPLPPGCAECEWLTLCRSGCPRNRRTSGEEGRRDYFCAGYRRFFDHAGERLRDIATRVERWSRAGARGRAAGARPNDYCPCGSGRKHRACCGDPRLDRSYLFRPPAG